MAYPPQQAGPQALSVWLMGPLATAPLIWEDVRTQNVHLTTFQSTALIPVIIQTIEEIHHLYSRHELITAAAEFLEKGCDRSRRHL